MALLALEVMSSACGVAAEGALNGESFAKERGPAATFGRFQEPELKEHESLANGVFAVSAAEGLEAL